MVDREAVGLDPNEKVGGTWGELGELKGRVKDCNEEPEEGVLLTLGRLKEAKRVQLKVMTKT